MTEKEIIPSCQAHALLTLADAMEKFDFNMRRNTKNKMITITSPNLSLIESLTEINPSELRKRAAIILDRNDTPNSI